jgi:hypothetical protein
VEEVEKKVAEEQAEEKERRRVGVRKLRNSRRRQMGVSTVY